MNAQLDAATAKMTARIVNRSTAQLVKMFDTLGLQMHNMGIDHFEDCATVRRFITDELERRDPAAFDRWMDQDVTNSPAGFFA